MSDLPQFWIDVGGTFTDCICLQPDGSLVRRKVLSSGVTKGAVGAGSSAGVIVDQARAADPADFWAGYQLRLLAADGSPIATGSVRAFDTASGRLSLEVPLTVAPIPGQPYELVGGEEAPLLAIRRLLGLPLASPIPPVVVRLGTTRGTNALLTRRGAPTALVTTRGFGDILHIGYQNRPKLFELSIKKPEPLFTEVIEIAERVTADGQVLTAPAPEAIRQELAAARHRGVQSLAICLLHGYAHPEHERLVEKIAREVGFQHVSTSHRVAPLVKIVSRGDTTVMDSYLNPVLQDYVARLQQALGSVGPASRAGRGPVLGSPSRSDRDAARLAAPTSELRIMTSAGGLVSAGEFLGKDSVLSGPAGGVVGFSHVARSAGFERAIGFDMGGTSTDVARFDGRYELEYETEKAGVRVVAPMLAIETVAAGGGSICSFDGVKLVVGPDSAGADPGPACYGRGGPLAVTDLNVFLGKILPERFPFPLVREAIAQRLDAVSASVAQATGQTLDHARLCEGFLQVANANMVKAIRRISLAKGADPREYVLVAFGGAAGQHACAVARELGIKQILNHPDAGLLSAYGIGKADIGRHRAAGIYRDYSPEVAGEIASRFVALERDARDEVLREGIAADRIEVQRSLDLRYRGLDSFLTIAEPESGDWVESYAAEHERLYGYRQQGRAVEVVAARVEVIGRTPSVEPKSVPLVPRQPESASTVEAYFDGAWRTTQVFDRRELHPGDSIVGPAIVVEQSATTVIDPGWRGQVLGRGELLLADESGASRAAISTEADPIMLEVFNNQFAGIAEQMGVVLRNTASSVNVKERLDFSCALFTATGDLVVNAPHIPVHLGAMSETVKRIVADNPDLAPGDTYVTNDPYRGGSHLPDVTVVTPVHDPASGRLVFFTASRAHHAEIGGVRPGSLPPMSRNLAEEGVLVRNFKLVDRGRSRIDELARLLTTAPYPTRNLPDNLADVTAQLAANRLGVRELGRLVQRYSLDVVEAYMQHIQAAAERKVRARLAQLPPGEHAFVDHLDDGTPIAVTITIEGAGTNEGAAATIDFTGTGPVVPGNLNANRAIVTAAVMYSLRTLLAEDIPLNQGVLAPVRIVLPECVLNPREGPTPEQSPAVVGGNVETSQRTVDVLLGALQLAAASQGTMNSVVFGDETFGYYETICGGSGATAGAPGADAVHTHMTNTRLTDPEVLEQRYPVRVREFSIRRGSGGSGRHRGGDGIVRRLEFLRELDVSIVSQRRGPFAPYGLAGGEPGALGRNSLRRADGTVEPLSGVVQFRAAVGDVLTIETPGGGGWGKQ